ncbi:MAG: hypothetical protein SNJ74_01570 [Fimbriimonadaceae bacterium]
MSDLKYLTVQDMLWINLQVCRKVNRYDYARLEEATYYQYGYGKSLDLVGQAGRFVKGFVQKAPFAEGNEATAFVGMVGFLKINGRRLRFDDAEALDWFRRHVLEAPGTSADLADFVIEDSGHHGPISPSQVNRVLRDVLAEYPETVSGLHSVRV